MIVRLSCLIGHVSGFGFGQVIFMCWSMYQRLCFVRLSYFLVMVCEVVYIVGFMSLYWICWLGHLTFWPFYVRLSLLLGLKFVYWVVLFFRLKMSPLV